MKKLIIFDCDGVLVDSETLASQVFSRQLQHEGIEYSPEECLKAFKGFTLQRCLELLNERGHNLDDQFINRLSETTRSCFEKDLKVVDGVQSVLESLNQLGVEYCVASNGSLAKVKHSLRCVGLERYFGSRCFSAEMVENGKPEPDLFLFAAQSLGYLPQHCAVVEDSTSGVIAANRARMNVWFYDEANANADIGEIFECTRFESMHQLIRRLGFHPA